MLPLTLINDRLVIPSTLREDVLNQIHEGRQGIEKCKERAGYGVYWPEIARDIEKLVTSCMVCQNFQHKNRRKPLVCHEILPEPEKNSLLGFKGWDFLIVID